MVTMHEIHSQSSCKDNMHNDNADDNQEPGLLRVLIVTHVPDSVFEEDAAKDEFQQLFSLFEPSVEFLYLKTFRRARVEFQSSHAATRARVHLHERELLGSSIRCYFAKPMDSESSSESFSRYLLPPKPEKQFLISPPSSPPDGWESVNEKQPSINYDLIAAITSLAPGEAHEVHTASETQPGIVVHVCDDPEGFKDRPQILQTRCPPSNAP